MKPASHVRVVPCGEMRNDTARVLRNEVRERSYTPIGFIPARIPTVKRAAPSYFALRVI